MFARAYYVMFKFNTEIVKSHNFHYISESIFFYQIKKNPKNCLNYYRYFSLFFFMISSNNIIIMMVKKQAMKVN